MTLLTPLLLVALMGTPPPKSGSTPQSIALTEAQVDAEIARLSIEGQRLDAVDRLLSFGWMELSNGGSMILNTSPLEKRAIQAVRSHRDDQIVRAALTTPGHPWARRYFARSGDVDQVRRLLPEYQAAALNDEDYAVRQWAQHSIVELRDQQAFLKKCRDEETAIFNIEELLRNDFNDSRPPLDFFVMKLLNDPRTDVRAFTLVCIGSNSNRAPVRRIKYSRGVFDRVMELTRAAPIAERRSALWAAAELRAFDPAGVRARLIEAAGDPESGVRDSVPWMLADMKADPSVRAVLEKLRSDPAEGVRYAAASQLGFEGHRDELEAFAGSKDPVIASMAVGRLKQMDAEAARGAPK